MRVFKIGFWVLFTVAFLATAVSLIGQNGELLDVTVFYYTTQAYPKWAILLGAVGVGALLATLFFIVELIILETRNIRLRRVNRQLERQIVKLGGSLDPKAQAIAKSAAVEIDDDLSDV